MKKQNQKQNRIVLIATTLAIGLTAAAVLAQDGGGPPGGQRGPGGPRPAPPIIGALDVNKDGVIDAAEIANASNALKTLDKNKDGVLTQDEIGGPRPGGDRGGAGGPPGQRPPRPAQQ
jgi:hypothetical protein